ncbi:MAG: ABC-type transport auxiliary lipoprotein family protein [Sideroxyarcus sp.]|nr:ABC-type transport auxiliary lipoprotein family protein [Sideroxyarcus sp.]
MIHASFAGMARQTVAVLLITLVGGCAVLNPAEMTQPIFYSLDNATVEPVASRRTTMNLSKTAPTLIVNPVHAVSGFDSQRIIYVREPHRLDYYAYNKWVDTPARMVTPLIISALESRGTFRAVILTPSAASGDLRLDTEIIRLQHELWTQPSRVRLTLRAYIVESTTREVLAAREFEAVEIVKNENPYGVVVAANHAVQAVLQQLAIFSSDAAEIWQAAAMPIQ